MDEIHNRCNVGKFEESTAESLFGEAVFEAETNYINNNVPDKVALDIAENRLNDNRMTESSQHADSYPKQRPLSCETATAPAPTLYPEASSKMTDHRVTVKNEASGSGSLEGLLSSRPAAATSTGSTTTPPNGMTHSPMPDENQALQQQISNQNHPPQQQQNELTSEETQAMYNSAYQYAASGGYPVSSTPYGHQTPAATAAAAAAAYYNYPAAGYMYNMNNVWGNSGYGHYFQNQYYQSLISKPQNMHETTTFPLASSGCYSSSTSSSTPSPEPLVVNQHQQNLLNKVAEAAAASTRPDFASFVPANADLSQVTLKKPRITFSGTQVHQLEQEFKKQCYLARPQRISLALHLGLSERQVKIWFQNRRMKAKKERNMMEDKLRQESQAAF